MWYENEHQIQYNQPIFASHKLSSDRILLLLYHESCKKHGNHGYDWFNISTGVFETNEFYKSVSEAIRYGTTAYNIGNGDLVVRWSGVGPS